MSAPSRSARDGGCTNSRKSEGELSNEYVRSRAIRWFGTALALIAGCALLWIDTRPGWDDTGITAGLLCLSSAAVTLLGLGWWLATLLVAGPLVCAEFRTLGAGFFLPLLIAAGGALLGYGLRRALRSDTERSSD